MATSCHHGPQTSGHTHKSARGGALLLVGTVFCLFGLAEVALAAPLGPSAAVLAADGAHNFADAGWFFGAYALQWLWTTTAPRGKGPAIVSLLLGVAGPALYGIGLLSHGHKAPGAADPHQALTGSAVSARETSLMVILGLASLAVNQLCHRATAHHGHAGLSAHLLGDSIGALAIVVTALIAPFTHQSRH